MSKRIWVIAVTLLLTTMFSSSELLVLPISGGGCPGSRLGLSNMLSISEQSSRQQDSVMPEVLNVNSVALSDTWTGTLHGTSEMCSGRKRYLLVPLCCPGWVCIEWVLSVVSDTLNLDPYRGRYVRLTGFLDSSQCAGVNATSAELLLSPCPAWTWRRLSHNVGSSEEPAVAASGSSIHVVWADNTFGNSEIFYKRSTDGGNTWAWQRLSNNAGRSRSPAIAVWGSNIHVVWVDDTFGNPDIFYKRSTDNGVNWNWQRLSRSVWMGGVEAPSVAVSGGNVHIVWVNSGDWNSDIVYKRSTNNGSTWTSQWLSSNPGWSWSPAIAVNGNNLHVAWMDGTFGNYEIFYKRSVNNGVSWNWQRLSSNVGWSEAPDIAVSGNNVHVAWGDDTFGGCFSCDEIFYKRSTDNGWSWGWQRLSANTGKSSSVAIAASGNDVRVVWQDRTFGDAEIFYKGSGNNGDRWTWQQLSNNPGFSERPDVALGTNGTYTVWMDDTFGNKEIFYKHGN